MIGIFIDVKKELKASSILRPRVFQRAWKSALRNVVAYWHRKYLPLHFKRAAHYRYSEYNALKTRKKEPLVDSGTLRDRLTDRRQLANISGTGNSVRLKMQIGRPPKYRPDKIKAKAWAIARREKIAYDVALQRVYRQAGYSPQAKQLFKRLIPAVNDQENRAMANVLRQTITSFSDDGAFRTGGRRGKAISKSRVAKGLTASHHFTGMAR